MRRVTGRTRFASVSSCSTRQQIASVSGRRQSNSARESSGSYRHWPVAPVKSSPGYGGDLRNCAPPLPSKRSGARDTARRRTGGSTWGPTSDPLINVCAGPTRNEGTSALHAGVAAIVQPVAGGLSLRTEPQPTAHRNHHPVGTPYENTRIYHQLGVAKG